MNRHYHKATPKTSDTNSIEAYWGLLENWSPDKKMALAKRLIESLEHPKPTVPFESLFGAWVDDRSADEIVEDIYQSRTSAPDREEL